METTTTKTYPRITALCKRVKEEMQARGYELRDQPDPPRIMLAWRPDVLCVGMVALMEDGMYAIIINYPLLCRSEYSMKRMLIHELVHWYDARLNSEEFLAQMDQMETDERPSEILAYEIERDLYEKT